MNERTNEIFGWVSELQSTMRMSVNEHEWARELQQMQYTGRSMYSADQ